jgi:Ca2+-binding EF-hand superfamily protein
LKEQIDNDRDLENLKNEISLKSDFNLLDAFRFFDLKGKGYITRAEVEDGMKEFGVYPSRKNKSWEVTKNHNQRNCSILIEQCIMLVL